MLTSTQPLQGHYPLVIIGGGIAGSAAAATLAKLGHQVAVFEKDVFPRDKLCGEFLSGESARLLNTLGCLDKVLAAQPARIRRMTYISPDGNRVAIDLPSEAFGLSRSVLDEILANYAQECGAVIHTRSEVRELRKEDGCLRMRVVQNEGNRIHGTDITADLIIACHGQRAQIEQSLKRRFRRNPPGYVGFKRHHAFVRGVPGDVALEALRQGGEMYLVRGGYCSISLIEENRVNVCMLLRQAELNKAGGTTWGHLIRHLVSGNTKAGERLNGLTCRAEVPVLSGAHIPFESRQCSQGRVFFAGDAAGMITPVCGDGQAMALESGICLAQLMHKHASNVPALQRAWQREWTKAFSRRMELGRFLQPLIMHPGAASLGAKVLNRWPGLRSSLATATCRR